MKLLITKTAYQGNTTLPGITANHENVNINGVDFVDCTITDTAFWGQVSQSLDSDSYGTGILLPPDAFPTK